MRVNIILACTECKRRNYSTRKNKKNTTGRLEMKKILSLGQEAHASQRNQVTILPQGGAPSPLTVRRGSSSNG